jgi:flagellar basal-body rod modification protein FlgD
MEKTNGMSLEETARAKAQADQVNSRLKKKDSAGKSDMNKDTFMKLLVTQLQHQDPTQPMADREFIAQMAQFSSLEQMQNINTAIQSMNRSSRVGEAYALLGRRVEAMSALTGKPVQGVVTKVFFRDTEIRVMVGKNEVGLGDIHAVVPNEEAAPRVPTSAIGSGVRTNFLPSGAINESKLDVINNDTKKDEPVKAYEKNEAKSPEKALGK